MEYQAQLSSRSEIITVYIEFAEFVRLSITQQQN